MKPRHRPPRVILAWDVEDPAPAALDVVTRLTESGAKAEAVYVAPPELRTLSAGDRRALRREWTSRLRRRGITLAVVEGDVIPRLLSYIDERRPDLVVLGTRGPGWLERLVLGSTAAAVRRRASAPVLVVPPRRRR